MNGIIPAKDNFQRYPFVAVCLRDDIIIISEF